MYVKKRMDIKRGRPHPGGRRYSTKAIKSIPISAKSFCPMGPIQFANTTREKGTFAAPPRWRNFCLGSAEGLWRRYSLLYTYTYTCPNVLDLTEKRETCFGVSAAVDGSVGLAAAPNRFLCHTDDCKEIIPVNGRPLTRTIWSFVHSVPFASANVAFAARRHLARILKPDVLCKTNFSSLSLFLFFPPREPERKYISTNKSRYRISFPLTRTSQAIALFSSAASGAPRNFRCVISEDV